MKKVILLISLLLIISSLSACESDPSAPSADDKAGTTDTAQTTPATSAADTQSQVAPIEADVDLTKLSSTMVYSEVYNMMTNPDSYYGKIVKMKGSFAIYQDSATGNIYYAVIIADATACCSQGLEFILEGDYTYPDDYPALGTEISVVGEFQTYEEGEYRYCHLIHAKLA